ELRRVFAERCGWSAVFITSGQVEHFVSQSRCLAEGGDPSLIYDWDNYRYIMPELNSSKSKVDGLLDPYEVKANWFHLVLPSLRIEATDAIPEEFRARAHETLLRLKLAKHPKVKRLRELWLTMYQRAELTLTGLRRFDPMLADALARLFAADPQELSEVELGFRDALTQARARAGVTTP
ncbi:MAG: hypothetical protein KC431_25255, partial [Myxococcales bacterium]|nr:hypothetical protein [Myxococcales bacterium]